MAWIKISTWTRTKGIMHGDKIRYFKISLLLYGQGILFSCIEMKKCISISISVTCNSQAIALIQYLTVLEVFFWEIPDRYSSK